MVVNRHDAALRRLELVEEDERDPGADRTRPGRPSDAPEGPRPPGVSPGPDHDGERPRRGRHVAVAVVAVAAVAAVFVASSVWQGMAGRDALLGSVGGVSTLATPPAPRWEASGTDAWAVGDALVVADGTALAGLSPADGSRRWSTDLGATPRCGGEDDAVTDSLVCLTGDEDAPTAWVVDAGGAVVSRVPLGDGPGRAVPAPQGGVLRWQRAGGTVTVTVQDASDASVRWSATVRPDDQRRPGLCRPQVSGSASGRVENGLLVVRGCRVSAVFTPDGARVDDAGEPVTVQVLPTAEGSFLRTTSASATGDVELTQLVRSDGTVERIVPGRPLVPLASDGTADPTRLLSVPSGVQAVDPSGSERWTLSGNVTQVLAVAGGTGVLDKGYVVAGVDLASGRETWSWAREDLGTTDAVTGAFTDGRVAAVVLSSLDGTGTARVVALDLDDGEVLWDERVAGDGTGLRALGGTLVLVDPAEGRVVALG